MLIDSGAVSIRTRTLEEEEEEDGHDEKSEALQKGD